MNYLRSFILLSVFALFSPSKAHIFAIKKLYHSTTEQTVILMGDMHRLVEDNNRQLNDLSNCLTPDTSIFIEGFENEEQLNNIPEKFFLADVIKALNQKAIAFVNLEFRWLSIYLRSIILDLLKNKNLNDLQQEWNRYHESIFGLFTGSFETASSMITQLKNNSNQIDINDEIKSIENLLSAIKDNLPKEQDIFDDEVKSISSFLLHDFTEENNKTFITTEGPLNILGTVHDKLFDLNTACKVLKNKSKLIFVLTGNSHLKGIKKTLQKHGFIQVDKISHVKQLEEQLNQINFDYTNFRETLNIENLETLEINIAEFMGKGQENIPANSFQLPMKLILRFFAKIYNFFT